MKSKLTKTFKEVQEIDSCVASLYQSNPDLKTSKFGYAYDRFFNKNYDPTLNELKEKLTFIAIDNALEDEKTRAVLTDKESRTGYLHSREGWKKLLVEEKELISEYNKKEIEIEPYLSSYIPELTKDQKEILSGCLI